ncbi:MAG: FadR family transcriptional regulator [Megasphaera sp.]|jgi:GntR family transcriptional repressor for pyruvate dehydrogenase complex|nr:FadR family transcriptional regulator [Megasphaera sp.]
MDILRTTQPIDRTAEGSSDNLYIQIVERIKKWIIDGDLKEGDKIPSERELAQIFNVSRVPVREAIKVLEFLGAVQNVKGAGVYVKKIDIHKIIGNIDFLLADPKHTLEELFEARELLETQATYYAALRRTDDDIIKMKSFVIEMEKDIELELDVTKASTDFHNAVINAGHNSVISVMYQVLADLLQYSRERSLKDPMHQKKALSYHKKILQKIIAGNPKEAKETAKEHLVTAEEVISRND